MKLVSVIIPTYKGTEHIQRAVDSAIMQDYPNLEVIVVDDNGDGTLVQIETEKQIEKYKENPQFCYFKHNINRNGSAARNTGVRYASGEYLNFLDDDDRLGPGKISYQIKQIEGLPYEYGISYSSRVIKYDGDPKKKVIAEKSGDILFEYMMNIVTMGTASVLMRKEVWEELQGYDESYVRHQDREFFARILDRYKAIAAPDVWFERNYTFRNSSKNVNIIEGYARHYIKGMRENINSLTEEQFNMFVSNHMIGVANKYLHSGDFGNYWRIQKEFNNGLRGLPATIKQGTIWIKNKIMDGNFT